MIGRHPLSRHRHVDVAAACGIHAVGLPLAATLPPVEEDAGRDRGAEADPDVLWDRRACLPRAVACLHGVRLDVGGDRLTGPMTDDERTAIRLATAHYKWAAVRDQHVHDQLGMTPTRFWQHVGGLIERADVLAEMPVEVNRLRRLREKRAQKRTRRLDPAGMGRTSEPL